MNPSEPNDLYADLKALSATAFPKRCPACGRVYETAADFIARTRRLPRHSGLKLASDDDGQALVELYRNCECGSTLLDYFSDRRDNSPRGQERRAAFARLIRRLDAAGVEPSVARAELFKMMRGERSELIADLLKRGGPA